MLSATPQISAVVLIKFFISVRAGSQKILWKKSELQVKSFNHTWIYAWEKCSILDISYFRVCSHFSITAIIAIYDKKKNWLAVTKPSLLKTVHISLQTHISSGALSQPHLSVISADEHQRTKLHRAIPYFCLCGRQQHCASAAHWRGTIYSLHLRSSTAPLSPLP